MLGLRKASGPLRRKGQGWWRPLSLFPTGQTSGCEGADCPYIVRALRRLPSSRGRSRPLFPKKVLLLPLLLCSLQLERVLATAVLTLWGDSRTGPCLQTDGARPRPHRARAQPRRRRCAWSMVQACLVSHRDLCGQGLSRWGQKRQPGAQSSSGGVRRRAGRLGSSFSCSPSLPGEPVCCGPGGGGGEAPLLTQPKCAR